MTITQAMEMRAARRSSVFIKPSYVFRPQPGQEPAHCDAAMADFIEV